VRIGLTQQPRKKKCTPKKKKMKAIAIRPTQLIMPGLGVGKRNKGDI